MITRSIIAVALALCMPLFAGGNHDELTHRRIDALLESAERFHDLDMHDVAEALEEHAEELRHEASERHLERAAEALEGLHAGIEALEFLDRRDLARKLTELAHSLAERIDHHEHEHGRHEHEHEHEEEERDERRVQTVERSKQRAAEARKRDQARRELHIMRIAVDALVEADRERVADLLERAMHARELELAGRDDPRAREIRANAPTRGNQVEALMLAHRLLTEWKHAGQAEIVGSLIRTLHPGWDEATKSRPAKIDSNELRVKIRHLEAQLEQLELRLRDLKQR